MLKVLLAKNKLLVLFCLLLVGNLAFSQSASESGLNYSFKKLKEISVNPDWENKSFVTKYNRYLTKAKIYLEKIKKESSGVAKIAAYERQIAGFEKPYKEHVTRMVNKKKDDHRKLLEKKRAIARNRDKLIQERMAAMNKVWQNKQGAVFKDKPDNGVPNTVHKQHIGKIRFGSYQYKGTPNFVNQVKLETPFDYHLFLSKSVHNYAQEQARKTKDRRWLAASDNYVMFMIYANGRKIKEWLEVRPGGAKPETYYTGRCMTKKKINFNHARGDFYRYYGQKTVLESLKSGKHKIKVEAYLYNNTIRKENMPLLAQGEFTLTFSKSDWAKLDKERNEKPQRRSYSIACGHSIYFRTSPNGVKHEYTKRRGSTGSFSKGDKIYVYNPKTGKTKYLMTLTSATQPIVVPKSYCSY